MVRYVKDSPFNDVGGIHFFENLHVILRKELFVLFVDHLLSEIHQMHLLLCSFSLFWYHKGSTLSVPSLRGGSSVGLFQELLCCSLHVFVLKLMDIFALLRMFHNFPFIIV